VLERLRERLGGELVGDLRADTAAQVAVDRVEVPVEDVDECPRLRVRGNNRLGVDCGAINP
jgi:hypothetical protein